MASCNILAFCLLSLLAILLVGVFALDFSIKSGSMFSFNCSDKIQSCSASLYHVNTNIPQEEVALLYSVNVSKIKPISHRNSQDYLIEVPCYCQNINGTRGYFYNTLYKVKQGDSFVNVSAREYNGQAWEVGDEVSKFIPGHNVSIHLVCGCIENDSETVVTYTVQQHDTLSDIATLLSASVDDIQSMNSFLIQNPGSIDVGWVLFVPMNLNGLPAPNSDGGSGSESGSGSGPGRKQKWTIVLITLLAATILSLISLVIILVRRKRLQNTSDEDARAISKSLSASRAASLQQFYRDNMEDVNDLESDRPMIYSLEEIEEGTGNFDESKKLGEGGYGSVYFGVLEGQEVAIKKMRSSKSKEFFAELKVLCKVHHINVVELLGYSSGEEHFYLVYEYIRNGSLSDHLHDPLQKGYQPLSWTARTQIALDAAKGIEYIHDHTKARYVHRDIKTSNILLDEGLRAKVADFGLAKLVERSNDDDLVATRLVGTPGYLPPESVKELQVTTKTDVFAFGVVLAELITGQRALVRDTREPAKLNSLINLIYKIFDDVDPESALEDVVDMNLRGSYPMENVYKMAEVSGWCLNEDPIDRPEMRDIVGTLAQITVASMEWEASLGGSSQVFSGLDNGR